MSTDTAINWHDNTTRRYLTSAVARPQPGEPRRCFYVDDYRAHPDGIVPVLVVEDEPGYSPMYGETAAGTWHWGATLDEAWEIADKVNAELFGLDRAAANQIVGSSMRAQDAEDGEEFEQQCEVCGGYFEADEETSVCPDCETED